MRGVGGGSVALVMGGGSAWCRWWQCCTHGGSVALVVAGGGSVWCR